MQTARPRACCSVLQAYLGRHCGLHIHLCQSCMAHVGRQCGLHAQPMCLQSRDTAWWRCGVAASRPHRQPHLSSSASTVCTAARQAALALHASSDVAEDVRRVIEQAERAASTWSTVNTDFYTPAVVAEAQRALAPLSEVDLVTWGGYPQAERCRLTVGRGDAVAALAADPQQMDSVAAVNVKGTFMFDPKNHRDFLGACLGTGIERSKVGDILIQGEQGAHIMVVPELVMHLEMSLKSVGKVSVETQEMALSELKVREPQVQDIKSVEASLRLDAIASAGFRMSRSKITEMIKKGDVRLNWKEVTSASRIVKEGDLISCAGKGRCEVKQLGTTKKGKHMVQLQRLI